MPQEKKYFIFLWGKNNTEIVFPVDLPEQKPTSLVILRQVRIYSNTFPESRQMTQRYSPRHPLQRIPALCVTGSTFLEGGIDKTQHGYLNRK